MRKKYIYIITFILFLTDASAQIGFGLRGGFGVSNSSQELVTGLTKDLGAAPTFGLMINYELDLHFSAGMEVNYAKYSETLNYPAALYPNIPTVNRTQASTTSTISYLQIPLYGRVTFGEKKYKAFISFAPYIGIGLSGEWKNGARPIGSGPAVLLDSTYKATFKQGDFKRLDLGGQVGIGGQYTIGKSGALFIETRLQIGFLDFWNKLTPEQTLGYTSQVNEYLPPGASWRAINVSLGYLHNFKIPKKTGSAAVKKAGKQR
jgi:hypothetical protein